MLSSGSPQPGLWRVATTPMFSLYLNIVQFRDTGQGAEIQKPCGFALAHSCRY